MRHLRCPFRKNWMLAPVVTMMFSVREIVGIRTYDMPTIVRTAVYEEPPPKPTDEYTKAMKAKSGIRMKRSCGICAVRTR